MTARINAFRQAVVATYRASFGTGLRSAEEQFGRFNLEELERTTIAAPALRFAVLDTNLGQTGEGKLDAKLRVAAFLIAEGKTANEAAWALAEVAAAKLPNQRWGLTSIVAPEQIQIQPVISGGLKNKQVAVVALEWRQTLIGLGASVFDGQGVVIDGVLVNGETLPPEEEAGNA